MKLIVNRLCYIPQSFFDSLPEHEEKELKQAWKADGVKNYNGYAVTKINFIQIAQTLTKYGYYLSVHNECEKCKHGILNISIVNINL